MTFAIILLLVTSCTADKTTVSDTINVPTTDTACSYDNTTRLNLLEDYVKNMSLLVDRFRGDLKTIENRYIDYNGVLFPGIIQDDCMTDCVGYQECKECEYRERQRQNADSAVKRIQFISGIIIAILSLHFIYSII